MTIRSVTWLHPYRGRLLHAFVDGEAASLCRLADARDTVPSAREYPRCSRCAEALGRPPIEIVCPKCGASSPCHRYGPGCP